MNYLKHICIIFQIPGDIENEVESKRQKMSDIGLNVQPYIIVITSTVTEVGKCYIRVDDITYESDSFLKALYGLFKIYLVYNIAYPVECENVCYFVQWCLLNIRTSTDVQIPFVYNFINRLKKSKT